METGGHTGEQSTEHPCNPCSEEVIQGGQGTGMDEHQNCGDRDGQTTDQPTNHANIEPSRFSNQ